MLARVLSLFFVAQFFMVSVSALGQSQEAVSIQVPIENSSLTLSSHCHDSGDNTDVFFDFRHEFTANREATIEFYWSAYKKAYEAMKQQDAEIDAFDRFFGGGPFKHWDVFAPRYHEFKRFERSTYDFQKMCDQYKSEFGGSRSYLTVGFSKSESRPLRSCDGTCVQVVDFEVTPTFEIHLRDGQRIKKALQPNFMRSKNYTRAVNESMCSDAPQPDCPPPYEG